MKIKADHIITAYAFLFVVVSVYAVFQGTRYLNLFILLWYASAFVAIFGGFYCYRRTRMCPLQVLATALNYRSLRPFRRLYGRRVPYAVFSLVCGMAPIFLLVTFLFI